MKVLNKMCKMGFKLMKMCINSWKKNPNIYRRIKVETWTTLEQKLDRGSSIEKRWNVVGIVRVPGDVSIRISGGV